jgi:hypothetical protein
MQRRTGRYGKVAVVGILSLNVGRHKQDADKER